MSNYNVIDLVIVISLISRVIGGYKKGFLVSAANLVSFLVAIFVATRAYPVLSALVSSGIGIPRGYGNLIGFLAVLLPLLFLFNFLSSRLYPIAFRLLKNLHLSNVNRLAGIVPNTISGLIWLALVLGILSWFPVSFYVQDLIAESRIGGPMVRATTIIEPQVEKIAGKAIEDTIGFLTTRGTDEDWKLNIPPNAKSSFDPAAEVYMLSLINEERGLRALKPLMPDYRLTEVARKHSVDMVEHNFFSHKSPTAGYLDDRLAAAGVFYLIAGENLAYAQDIELAHNSLMESQGHRENILRQYYGKAGIGIVNAGRFGYVCTQVFTN